MAALDFPMTPPPVDGQIFKADNGVWYTWKAAGSYWSGSLGTAIGNLEGYYVNKTGDKMFGNLTLGTESTISIVLNATSGAATFDGRLTLNGSGAGTAAYIGDSGQVTITYDGNINAAGSSTFGNVGINGPAGGVTALSVNTQADNHTGIVVTNSAGTGNPVLLNVRQGTDSVASISAEGSITAAGGVSSGAVAAPANTDIWSFNGDKSYYTQPASADDVTGFIIREKGSGVNYEAGIVQVKNGALGISLKGSSSPRATTVTFNGDGSSEFAGDMAIGITGSFTPSTPAISLNADGTSIFSNELKVEDSAGSLIKLVPNGQVRVNSESTTNSIASLFIELGDDSVTRYPNYTTVNGNLCYRHLVTSTVNRIDFGTNLTSTTAIRFQADGFAYFASGQFRVQTDGTTLIGGTLPAAPNILLNAADGTASFVSKGFQIQETNIANHNGGNEYFRLGKLTDENNPIMRFQTKNDASQISYSDIKLDGNIKTLQTGGTEIATLRFGVGSSSANILSTGMGIDYDGNFAVGLQDNGSSKILLRGANGTATFAGNIECGGFPSNASRDRGVGISTNGYLQVSNSDSDGPLFLGYKAGTQNAVVKLYNDGSASFAGGDGVSTNQSCGINSSGTLQIRNDSNSANVIQIRNNSSSNVSMYVTAAGSASFAGNVTSNATVVVDTRNSSTAAQRGQIYVNPKASSNVFSFSDYATNANGEIKFNVTRSGSATFAGTVTANGSVLTRANGTTLDLGDRAEKVDAALTALKSAAAAAVDFAALKSAIATALADI